MSSPYRFAGEFFTVMNLQIILFFKKIIIKNTATKILFLLKCYQTSKYFPDPEDNRLVTHYGYYNSPDTNDYFFANEVSHHKEECFKYAFCYKGGVQIMVE